MIDKQKQNELDKSVRDVTDAMDIVSDSMLKLDDKTEKLSNSTKDLTASYDITSDSSLEVAQEQEKLANQIKGARKDNKRSNKVENELVSARRKQLEDILNNKQPLVDYSQGVKSQNPEQGETAKPMQEDTRETLKEFIQREVGDRREFVENFKEENQKTGKFVREIAKKANIVDRMKKSETSATAKILGHTMSAGIGMVTGTINDLLSTIPGYNQAANATKFVGGSIIDAHNARKEKKLDAKANAAYEEKKADATSRFQQIPQNKPEDKVKTDRNNQEQKKERQENGRERENNEKRHKSLIDVLKGIQMSMLIGKLIGGVGFVLSGLVSGISVLSGAVLGLAPMIAGALSAAVGGLIAKFSGLFDKIPGLGSKTQTPSSGGVNPNDASKDPKKSPKTTTPDGKKTPTPEPKPGQPAKIETPKTKTPTPKGKAGILSKAADLGKKGWSVAADAAKSASKFIPKSALTGAGMAVRVAGRAIPFVGAGLMAYELYNFAKENPELLDKGVDAAKGAWESLTGSLFGKANANEAQPESKLGNEIKAGETEPVFKTLEKRNQEVEEFRAKQQREKEERDARRQEGALMAAVNNTTYNSMNSVLPSGFGEFRPDQPQYSYGVQPST
ncbi:hypothetical protein ASswx1_189 [Aeromonas phage Asswx_1]|uniref:Uncharacterized protein n=1 Tax=Aeromonas phage Asswx_1 TaxID=2419739 RepID=A0A411B8A6_9CAUD|nr:hypothetical protein ASswx1_189 [Aeromonas phage Asswx_1]